MSLYDLYRKFIFFMLNIFSIFSFIICSLMLAYSIYDNLIGEDVFSDFSIIPIAFGFFVSFIVRRIAKSEASKLNADKIGKNERTARKE